MKASGLLRYKAVAVCETVAPGGVWARARRQRVVPGRTGSRRLPPGKGAAEPTAEGGGTVAEGGGALADLGSVNPTGAPAGPDGRPAGIGAGRAPRGVRPSMAGGAMAGAERAEVTGGSRSSVYCFTILPLGHTTSTRKSM